MKIGIISFWDTQNNYGQVLQGYALQEVLRRIGHEPFHIKYVDKALTVRQRLLKLFSRHILLHPLSFVKQHLKDSRSSHEWTDRNQHNPTNQTNHTIHSRCFDDFRAKFMSFSEIEYDEALLKSNPPKADCYVCGSDQIWCVPSDAHMLNFGSKNVRRVAYAASMGGHKMEAAYLASKFRRNLRRLDVVTLREADGVEECKRLGRPDARLVPDPVFLLSAPDYRKIAARPSMEKKYVLLYFLGNKMEVDIRNIYKWADKQGLEVIYVAAQGRQDDYPKEYPTIEEWIGLIDGAQYVFTNSFHGMVMSIILNKKFMVIPLSNEFSKMNSRLTTTLSSLYFSDRIYNDDLNAITADIDYYPVNNLLEKQRGKIIHDFQVYFYR